MLKEKEPVANHVDRNMLLILNEFNAKRSLYKDYCVTLFDSLESLLKADGYKHQISYRIKETNSVVEKIARKKSVGRVYQELDDMEDVAGIRVVFYTEVDRKRFIKSLKKVFDGDIRVEETSKVSGYESTHIIVTFGQGRQNLGEHERFRGLKCEIQLTLMLNHAWAELEHDILYKECAAVKQLDRKSYSLLRERMNKIMHDYIKKATLELESIVKKVRGKNTKALDVNNSEKVTLQSLSVIVDKD